MVAIEKVMKNSFKRLPIKEVHKLKRKGLSILFVVVLISSLMGSLALAPAPSPLVSEAQAAPGGSTVTTPDNEFHFSQGATNCSVVIMKWTEDNTTAGTLNGLTAILIEEGAATLACADIGLEWTYGGEPPTGWQSGGIDCTDDETVALGYDVEYVMGAPGGSELPPGDTVTWIKAFANRELDAFDGEVIVFQDEEGGTDRHYDEGTDTVLTEVVVSSEVMYTAELLGSTPDFWSSINGAVGAADPGDTVIVHPGTYEEPVIEIDKSLTLESASGDWSDTIIDNVSTPEIEIVGPFSPFSGHAVIDGFTITGGDLAGIYISDGLAHGGTVTVSNCFIHDNGDGILADGDLDGGIFIDDCIITENGPSSDGIFLYNVIGTVEVTDSVIGGWYGKGPGDETEYSYEGNWDDGIEIWEIADTGTVVIDNNKIVDNGDNGIYVAGPTSVNGELTITDNIIGAYDYGLEPTGYFSGNGVDGIEIRHVGVDGIVTIDGNKIAENNYDGIDFGAAFPISGTVVINDNIIGAWTQVEDENYYVYDGNYHGEGIYVWEVDSDGSLTITNNKIADNGWGDTGIWIETTSGDTTISGNDVGEWTDDTVPGGPVTYDGNYGPGIQVNNVPGGSLTIGPDNTVIGNTLFGIYIANNSNGDGEVTINDNFIDDNGTGGDGICLSYVDYATVSGNTITRHIEDTSMLAGVWLDWSNCNAIVNNTITGNRIGVFINEYSTRNGVVGNVISDNTLDGIWVDGDYNDILRNVISGNKGAVSDHPLCGIFLGSGAEDNVIYYNNITENTDVGSYGVYNNRTEDVDARWNWWGGDDTHLPESYGPFHGGTNPYGEGDAVSSYVLYEPWETTAYPYDTDPTDTPWDTTGPDIDMAVATPDMLSIYTALSEITGSSWTAESPFSLGPCDGDSRYCVITSDVDAEVPRGVRYVTIDLADGVEQLLGGTKLEDILPPAVVEAWEQAGVLKLCNGSFCCETVWTTSVGLEWCLTQLLTSLGEEQFFLMLEPGELEVPVTVTDWAGNQTQTTIDIAIVDEQLPVGEGWNLRSTPINLGINDWEHLTALGDGLDYDTAIRWNSELQTWEQLTDGGLLRGGVIVGDAILRPLDAIAIKASNFDSLGLIFNRNTTAAPSLGVHEGWNLIGLAVSPPHDPFMPVNDALISIEEISPDGTRGYIIVDSPRQYVEVEKEYKCADCCGSIWYDWYFGQEDWEYLHHGAEAVPPIPNMTVGGGYWVFMERDDTLAGFSNTPVFLSLTLEQHEDLDCVPRYPGTTMTEYHDWMDNCYIPVPECAAGLQWSYITYKGEFTLDDVFTFYEEEMPEVCDWQFAGKGFDPTVNGYSSGYIAFWKHIGLPSEPYTMMCNIEIEVNAGSPDYLYINYAPFDIPTCPGTNLIMWETWYDGGMCPYLEFKGNATIEEAVEFYVEAMAKLQWEVVGTCSMCDMRYKLLFTKPENDCGDDIMLLLWVDIYNLDPEIESGIIQVEINRDWQPAGEPLPSLSVWCPSYGDPDYCCLPSYPDTTMVYYEDWMDDCDIGLPACVAGLQWSMRIYEGEFTLDDFFNFYEEEMPEVCDWQFAGEGIVYEDAGDAEGYIGFWKEGEFSGVPYYTMVAGMWAEVNADGDDYIYMLYVPFDIPTCPGTNLIVWETVLNVLMDYMGEPVLSPLMLEFKGNATIEEAVEFYVEAMAELQWEVEGTCSMCDMRYKLLFSKPEFYCEQPGTLLLWVDIYNLDPEIESGIIQVKINRDWQPIEEPIPSLSVWCPSYGDLCCIPPYPDTTMVEYYDWMDEEFCAMMTPELACIGGLQWSISRYEGEFILADFFNFYEEEMPRVCDWQFVDKAIVYQDAYGAEGYIAFWKHIPYDPQGEPPYTLIAGMWAEVDADGPDYIYVLYAPFDIPTCPGTNMIVWETVVNVLMYYFGEPVPPLMLEFKGSATVDEALAFYVEAMAKLQWEAIDSGVDGNIYYTVFEKPIILCGGPIMLHCDVVIYEMAPDIIFVEIYRYFWDVIPLP